MENINQLLTKVGVNENKQNYCLSYNAPQDLQTFVNNYFKNFDFNANINSHVLKHIIPNGVKFNKSGVRYACSCNLEATNNNKIIYIDFISFFPHILCLYKFIPQQIIKKDLFLLKITELINYRIATSNSNDLEIIKKRQEIKFFVNSLIGKIGKYNDKLYDPLCRLNIVITGQLIIYKILDSIIKYSDKETNNISIKYINTDGFILYIENYDSKKIQFINEACNETKIPFIIEKLKKILILDNNKRTWIDENDNLIFKGIKEYDKHYYKNVLINHNVQNYQQQKIDNECELIIATYNPNDYTNITQKEDFEGYWGKICTERFEAILTHEDLIKSIQYRKFIRYPIFISQKCIAQNFKYSWYCMVDIDGSKLHIDNVFQILNKHNLAPTIIYHSFSSGEDSAKLKYHCIYRLKNIIRNYENYKIIIDDIINKVYAILKTVDQDICIDTTKHTVQPIRFRSLKMDSIIHNKHNVYNNDLKVNYENVYNDNDEIIEVDNNEVNIKKRIQHIREFFLNNISYQQDKNEHHFRTNKGDSRNLFFTAMSYRILLDITNNTYLDRQLVENTLSDLPNYFKGLEVVCKPLHLQTQSELVFRNSKWDKLVKDIIKVLYSGHIQRKKNRINYENAIKILHQYCSQFYHKNLYDNITQQLEAWKLIKLIGSKYLVTQQKEVIIDNKDLSYICTYMLLFAVMEKINIIVISNYNILGNLNNILKKYIKTQMLIKLYEYQIKEKNVHELHANTSSSKIIIINALTSRQYPIKVFYNKSAQFIVDNMDLQSIKLASEKITLVLKNE